MSTNHDLSDEELVMFLDGELAPPRLAAVREHVAHCWQCRTRLRGFEAAVAGYMEHYRAKDEQCLKAAGPGATARLRAAIRQLEQPRPSFTPGLNWLRRTPVLLGAGAVLFLPVLLWVWPRQSLAAGPLPDARLTPGAVRFVSSQQVCQIPVEDEGKLVPKELAEVVFREYRITGAQPREYEVDYLISPALGGATAVQNLWPLPYADGIWTSRVKDALEDRLRTLVCAGKLDVQTAQRDMADNWIAAYQKYFHSRQPIEAHARFVKDSPWE
jgi:anti-sigma factor RsiW